MNQTLSYYHQKSNLPVWSILLPLSINLAQDNTAPNLLNTCLFHRHPLQRNCAHASVNRLCILVQELRQNIYPISIFLSYPKAINRIHDLNKCQKKSMAVSVNKCLEKYSKYSSLQKFNNGNLIMGGMVNAFTLPH